MVSNPLILKKEGLHRGPDALPRELVLAGAPLTDSWSHSEIPLEGALRYGVWQCEPGTINVPFYPDDEIFTLTAGHVRLTNKDGSAIDVLPGQACVLRRGWVGTWTTIERAEKSFVAIASVP